MLSAESTATEGFMQTEDVYLFPAGLEQHRYWILDQVDASSTASNMAITCRLVGKVNDALVEASIRDLALRHEALRTTFRMIDGVLHQVISDAPLFDFRVSDFSDLPDAERLDRAEQAIHEHSHVAMDLAKGPLFFVHLIHVSHQQHFLACTMHHIVCDGWSNGVLVRDFCEIYSAHVENRAPKLPELPFQFADFTVWQENWLNSEAAEEALSFWREQIRRGFPAVDLPTDYPRTARKDGPGHIESQLISQSINERLRQFCRQYQATTHQVLLAVFQGLIARYTSQEEFLLGSSIANRTQPGMDDVVGRFANPQVILADVKDDPTFDELLRRVSEWSTFAYAHQDLPFSRLMEEFQLDQNGATSQFLQIYFVYQKAFMQPQEATELQIIPRPSVSGGVNFDLLVSIVERAEGPRLQIEFNTDLFRRERIRQFIQQYIRILDAVLENPALRVSQLPLLSSEDELALRSAGQGPKYLRKLHRSVIEVIDQHAKRNPEGIVFRTDTQRITWNELAERSIQFAFALHAKNIQGKDIVALRLETSIDATAAALAALRLGAIVLPVAASTSKREWGRLHAEIKPAITLAGADFSRDLPFATAFDDLRIPATHTIDFPHIEDAAPAWCGIHGNSERYELQISSHYDLLTSLMAAAQSLRLTAGDVVAIKPASQATDAWVDLLLPLISGAGLMYLPDAGQTDLQAIFDRERVTFAFATGFEWLEFMRRGWAGDKRLQIVCRGGRLPAHAAKHLLPAGRLWSMVSSTLSSGPISLAAIDEFSLASNPIAPLPGQQFTVIDKWNHAVPEGVIGELFLLDKEDKKRTGFLAQYGQQTGFQIVDFTHNQIRQHGYRLRLGELEDRLTEISWVSYAKARMTKTEDGFDQLTAYISGESPVTDVEKISRQLRTTAPAHISCATLLATAHISLKLDGSPDEEAITLSSTSSSHEESDEYTPARDEIEAKLVSVWEDVLGVKNIGVRTSFFSLGGYSLMIVRLFARINKAMNASLPITTIFNAPTIEQLADILRGRKAYTSLVPVKTEGTRPPLFMILSYLLYGSLPKALGKDYPFYGLRELDNEGLMTPEERAASYVKAIRSVQPEGPYYLAGWCAAGPITIEVGRQLMESGQTVGLVTLFDSWHPQYAESLKRDQKAAGNTGLLTTARHKYSFYRDKVRGLSATDGFTYLKSVGVHKLRSLRNAVFLKHFKTTTRIFKLLGQPLPDFMHNVTSTTLMSLQQYEPQPFDGNVLLIRATKAPSLPGADATCGWNSVVRGNIDVAWVPGDHETMFMEPNLAVVGKTLRDKLEAVIQDK